MSKWKTKTGEGDKDKRFFGRVGLVQTDLHGSLLDTTMIDMMWDKQLP
jgi:hypothetical protein